MRVNSSRPSRTPLSVAVGGAAAALLVTVLPAQPVSAAEPEIRPVATGLDNPRGVDVGHDGAVYVAEAGRGGATLVDGVVAGQPMPTCVGMTSSITKISRGTQTRMGSYPSLAAAPIGPTGPTCSGPGGGIAAIGAHDVAVSSKRRLSVTVGLGASMVVRDRMPAGLRDVFGTVQRLDSDSPDHLADLMAYEQTEDPDGAGPDSNPYGIVRLKGDTRLATDAGGNSLLRLDAAGSVETLATFPNLAPTPFTAPSCYDSLPAPIKAQLPPVGARIPAQAVPTSVAEGPDGHYYVGTLTGFPFTKGNARIYKVDRRTHAVTTHATGLNHVVGIAFGPDGALYAAQMSDESIGELEICGRTDAVGSVVRVASNGSTSTVVGGLPLPGGIDVADDGSIYVSVQSVVPGEGQVWRIRR